ncbi:MAG: macro domain-containing protein [Lachnospiraceae bacterium]|nr:macro domain-containing protein [Lachnospiraceae bacterium]
MAFQIVRDDITRIKADAIVNPANPEPVYMAGTDSAIYAAAGAGKLLEERRKIGRIGEGEVAVTPAFDLDAKYIFHTVGPVWQGGDHGEIETVRKCYAGCLEKAVELGIESIAFPLLATGVYGFPKTEALLTATSVFSSFLAENEMDIILVVFDNESFELSGKIFAGVNEYIDEHYVGGKLEEEYYAGSVYEERQVPFPAGEECAEEAPGNAFAGETYGNAFAKKASDEARTEEAPCEYPGEAPDDESDDRIRRERIRKERLKRERLSRERGNFVGGGMQSASAANPAFHMGMVPVPPPAAACAPLAKMRSLDDVVKNISETWSESLLRMITEKGYSDTEVYKRANVDRKLFSKIRSNRDYKPKKSTAVAFALALRLNLDETKDFIGRAGYAFSPSSKFDLIVEYFIENEVYDFMTINMALFEHEEPLLG